MKFNMTHEINCDAETFWKIFFDKVFNETLYRKHLGFTEFEILEQRETDGQIIRKARAQPKVDMPAAVQKLLGSGFRYTEEGTFDKGTKIWRWKTIPSTLAEKTRNEGTLRLEAAGENRVKRVAEINNEIKVFGLGGMLEGFAEKALRDGWGKSAVFMNQWLKDNPKP